jgi:hypothetical protein
MQKDLFLPERHIIPISGKDSLATALFMLAKEPDLPYEFMFNPTGAELPEVFEWLIRVEKHLGKPIIRVGKDLEGIIKNERNGFLPSQFHRYCTNQSKIEPMENFIGNSPCYVYYGIRADEDRQGYNDSSKPNIKPVYPLKEAGIGLQMVYAIIKKAGLKPPTFFWKEIYDRVCEIIGEDVIKAKLSEYQIDVLFSWRTRANCYFCFNQRKYEWVGLLEHHPDLFWIAEDMEHNGSEFFWNGKNYPLTKIIERMEITKQNRVNAIVKYLQTAILSETQDDKGFIDILSVTSCGLLCGK